MSDIGSYIRIVPPSISTDGNGVGYMAWLDQVSSAKANYTLKYRTTTNTITASGGWMDWNSYKSLTNVSVYTQGFVSGAHSSGDNLYYALFSNKTFNQTKPIPMQTIKVCLWDGTGTKARTIYTMNVSWTGFIANSSYFLEGACGKILFDANNNMHLAWNNGTALFYKYVPFISGSKTYDFSNPVETVNSTAVMSEFSMISKSAGQVDIVFSAGNSTLYNDKELYLTSGGGNPSAVKNFSTPVELTKNNYEDTRPDTTYDTHSDILLTWSQESSIDTYKIMYMNVSSGSPGITTEISNKIPPLTVSSTSPSANSFDSSIVYLEGRLNFFYSDSRQFIGSGNQNPSTWNFMWQSFADPANLNNNNLTVLSISDTPCMNLFHGVCAIDNDIFASFISLGTYPIHIVKIDYVVPTIKITDPVLLETTGITQDAAYSINLPTQFNISFSVSEPDITFPSGLKWDQGNPLTIPNNQSITITIPSGSLTLGPHSFSLTVENEVGNSVTITRYLDFTGVDMLLVLTIVLIAVIAVAAVAILLLLFKYRKKFSERQVQLKLGGKEKAKGKEGWGEEAEAEEEEKEGNEDVDLKEDLKKVDM